MISLQERRITVTGGNGFLGSHLLRKLSERGCKTLMIADLPEYDLRTASAVRRMYVQQKPKANRMVSPDARLIHRGLSGNSVLWPVLISSPDCAEPSNGTKK